MNKETYSLKLIETVLQNHDNPVISSSFGKDSMVMTHLIMKIAGNTIPLLHINTGIEFPDVIKFRDKFIKDKNLTLWEAAPFPENYWGIVDKYGFPVGERGFEDDPDKPTTKCCYYLKKKPVLRAIKKYKPDLQFLGLRAVESKNRQIVKKKYGDYYFNSRYKLHLCHPLLDWTDKELWAYIEEEKIQIPSLYYTTPGSPTHKIRLGCWACPQGWNSGKGKWLRENYPSFYNTLMKKGFAEFVASKKLGTEVSNERALLMLENRPCMFDDFPL